MDHSSLLTSASIIGAFGMSVLIFRIQRELDMESKGEVTWIPLADWALLAATVMSLVVVVMLLIYGDLNSKAQQLLASATTLAIGYIPAVLAHYRLPFKFGRSGHRSNPEPAEAVVVALSVAAAIAVFLAASAQ